MANKVGLTDARIAGLKAPASGQIEVADGIVTGLRLRMGASGTKTYILRKRVQGKWLNVTIGRHGQNFTLAHARRKARDLLVDVEQGKSIARKPGAKRKGSKGVGTVAELYETYLAQQIVGKKRSANEFDRVFRKYIEPELGDRLADSITRSDVSRFVEKIAFERGKETLTMARIVYRHLSTFYSWALTRLEHLPANPCRDAWRPKRSEPRDRVLSDREVAALWQAAVEDGYPFGHLVQMLILTAQRRGEVLDATCDEFDFKGKVWTVPGDRAKNGKANVVPLSAQALEVITDIFAAAGIAPEDAHKQSQILLASKVTSTNSVSGLSKAWKRIRASVDEKLGYEAAHFTMHDIRRTVATGLQRIGIPLVVSEAVLNHQSGSAMAGVAGVYHRHQYTNEKREALALWGREVQLLVAKYPPQDSQEE
ncbi:tyrosine-type recombinase/integrase [Novosphingobium aerophilum]|uniref:Site-specific integrase n=1 Tax=Novosphingobium aerophilum TaxID=2839843 RepID=A0A7X1KAV7_9SPHN|nr:tyrosine-type recombinase/integrase [Novosphingobium aerophilum]MBC2650525.1 site-specific integrase [Novosphingobium aerophilum]